LARSRSRRSPASGDKRNRLLTTREAFRVLRSNLLVAISDLSNPVMVVTSAHPGEGKTVTSANLAQSLATAGQHVVLVDVDLRNPDSHRQIGAHNEAGVSDVLLDRRPLKECVQYLELPATEKSAPPASLYFLGTGPQVANPTELLAKPRAAWLLETLAAQADIVLLDTPPVLPVADTLVIGRLAAGAILVVETRTSAPAAKRAKDALTRNQTRILGVVLNRFESKYARYGSGQDDNYGYGYGYGFGSSGPGTAGNGSGRDKSGRVREAASPDAKISWKHRRT
jgi:capsular exopolysaccharide synthesis family protein